MLRSFPEVISYNTVSQRSFPCRKFPRTTISPKVRLQEGNFLERQFPRRKVSLKGSFADDMCPTRKVFWGFYGIFFEETGTLSSWKLHLWETVLLGNCFSGKPMFFWETNLLILSFWETSFLKKKILEIPLEITSGNIFLSVL